MNLRKSNRELAQAKRTDKTIKELIDSIDIEKVSVGELAVCFQPNRELSGLERARSDRYERKNIRTDIGLIVAAGAFAIYYGSAHSLEYRSHRFIFEQNGPTQYHRDSFNVDAQALGSRDVNLLGIEAIYNDTHALSELEYAYNRSVFIYTRDHSMLETRRSPAVDCAINPLQSQSTSTSS